MTLLKSKRFRKSSPVITGENLRQEAVRRLQAHVLNTSQDARCLICAKFCNGCPLNPEEKTHIEQAIRYQEQILLEEFGYALA